MSVRSTTRIIAALPGAVLIDKYGCSWFIGMNGAAVSHHTGIARVWHRHEYPEAQRDYGPFRAREDLVKYNIGGWA
jgi:hypothetical protein